MVRSGRWQRPLWIEDFPAVAGNLQRIEVKGDEVIEEKPLHLSSKDVYFGAQDVQRMPVSTRGPRRGG